VYPSKPKADDALSFGMHSEVGGVPFAKKQKAEDASISSVHKKTKAKWHSLSQPLADIDKMRLLNTKKRKAVREDRRGAERLKRCHTQPAILVTS
jgi:hypothetical protein